MEETLKEPLQDKNEERGGLFSNVFFLWTYNLLDLGSRKPLGFEDVAPLEQNSTAQVQKYFIRDVRPEDLLSGLLYKHKWSWVCILLLGITTAVLDYTAPVFIVVIENYLTSEQPVLLGLLYVVLLVGFKLLHSLCNQHFRFKQTTLELKLKAGLTALTYDKCLKVSGGYSSAQLINLVQVDIERIARGLTGTVRVLTTPLQTTIGVLLLFNLVGGLAAVAGFVMMILIFIANYLNNKAMTRLQKLISAAQDKRLACCGELVTQIKTVKVWALTDFFYSKLQTLRFMELSLQQKVLWWLAFSIVVNWGTRNAMLIAIVDTLAFQNIPLSASAIFAGFSVISVLNFGLRTIPEILSGFMLMIDSSKKVSAFLRVPDLEPLQDCLGSNIVVELNQVDVKVADHSILKGINLTIERGQKVALLGRVGSGKTSFLKALLGEVEVYQTSAESKIRVLKSVAYVSQDPWILNGSFRANVTFGQTYDPDKFDRVITACQLKQDVDSFSNKDLTEIGERGINLSGGQKTRVAIARAIYSEADLVLLDAPFGGLDAGVKALLFKEGILQLMASKTVIIATHSLELLTSFDAIYVIENQHLKPLVPSTIDIEIPHNIITCNYSPLSRRTKIGNDGKLVTPEDRAIGRVTWDVYWTYIKYGGGVWNIVWVCFFMIMWQVNRMHCDVFLSRWTDQTPIEQETNWQYNVTVFTISAMTTNLFIAGRLVFSFRSGLHVARKLFEDVIKALMRAPLHAYFDATPSGRILNRLSKDQRSLDSKVMVLFANFFGALFTVLFTVYISTFVSPGVLVVLPLPIYVFFRVQSFYLKTSRELIRLSSTGASPICQHFTETESGVVTIRAFGQQHNFSQQCAELLDNNNKVHYAKAACDNWLGISLELMADIFLAAFTTLIVCTRGLVEPGLAGVGLSYATYLPFSVFWLVNVICQLENEMVAVERARTLAL